MKSMRIHLLALVALFGNLAAISEPVARIGTESFDTLADAVAAANQMSDGIIELTADATVDGVLSVTADMTLLGAPACTLDVTRSGGFAIGNGATLTVDGLKATRTSAIAGGSVFTVDNGALVLTNGVSISGVRLKENGAVVWVKDGALAMHDGVVISDCTTGATTLGVHAVRVSSGTFDFLGGSILDCSSKSNGAGVCCESGAVLRLGGSATVRGNLSGTAANDIYLAEGAALPIVVRELTGSLGILAPNAAVGAPLATVDASVDAGAAASHFFRDEATRTMVAAASGSSLVWAEAPSGPQPVPETDPAAAVRVTDGAGAACYASLADAFEAAASGSAELTLLKDVTMDADLVARTDIVLNGTGHTVERVGSPVIAVTNVTLTVTGVELSGGTSRLIDVFGGTLTLGNGAVVRDVTGGGAAMVAPIVVWGGTLNLNAGSRICACHNAFKRQAGGSLAAGGAVVNGYQGKDGTTVRAAVHFSGGLVSQCSGSGAGGIYVGNAATAIFHDGGFGITGNASLDGAPSNLVVHDLSALTIDGAQRGGQKAIGFTEGVAADPDVVGVVTAPLTDAELVATARTFAHDTNGDIGVAVRRAGETLVVWSAAVSPEGTFVSADGNAYAAVTSPETSNLTIEAPVAATGLVYDGTAKTGVAKANGYEVSGNVATDAGSYVATVRLKPGYEWADGTTADMTIAWSIAKAVYDMSGVTFEDAAYSVKGPLPRTLTCNGTLPAGVTVSYTDNELGEVGSLTVTASFTGDAVNYEPIPDMTATLTIYDPDPPGPADPIPVVCQPFSFTAIDEQDDGSWSLTLAPGTAYCVYTLYTSDDLKNWTPVGDPLTLSPETPLEFSGAGGERQRFWKVLGADGVAPAE